MKARLLTRNLRHRVAWRGLWRFRRVYGNLRPWQLRMLRYLQRRAVYRIVIDEASMPATGDRLRGLTRSGYGVQAERRQAVRFDRQEHGRKGPRW